MEETSQSVAWVEQTHEVKKSGLAAVGWHLMQSRNQKRLSVASFRQIMCSVVFSCLACRCPWSDGRRCRFRLPWSMAQCCQRTVRMRTQNTPRRSVSIATTILIQCFGKNTDQAFLSVAATMKIFASGNGDATSSTTTILPRRPPLAAGGDGGCPAFSLLLVDFAGEKLTGGDKMDRTRQPLFLKQRQ